MSLSLRSRTVIGTAACLVGLVALSLAPYGWNLSALLHIDEVVNERHEVPAGTVTLDVPSYDGAQYYLIARNMRHLLQREGWPIVRERFEQSYAFQRILLPAFAAAVTFGRDGWLPVAMLGINVLALVAVCAVCLRGGRLTPLQALAVTFCPSAMVALHFTLAEPLALLLIAAFLVRYTKDERIGWVDVLLLSLLTLTREVNVLFAGVVFLYSLLKMRRRDCAMLLIPFMTFFALHGLIYFVFGEIPFLTSAGARQLPFSAPLKLLAGLRGYDRYTLSAIALFLLFVLPGFVWSAWRLIKDRRLTFLPFASFLFFCLMLTLADYIWGSMTSVGRVITPVYPLAVFLYAAEPGRLPKILTGAILLLGLVTALGLALTVHPFTIA